MRRAKPTQPSVEHLPRTDSADLLSAPKGLRSARFLVEGEEFAVLSFPVAAKIPVPPCAELTKAERLVGQLALKGFSNAEIATLRNASPRTVANQLQAIYRKLGVGSRVELARALAHVDLAAARPVLKL